MDDCKLWNKNQIRNKVYLSYQENCNDKFFFDETTKNKYNLISKAIKEKRINCKEMPKVNKNSVKDNQIDKKHKNIFSTSSHIMAMQMKNLSELPLETWRSRGK